MHLIGWCSLCNSFCCIRICFTCIFLSCYIWTLFFVGLLLMGFVICFASINLNSLNRLHLLSLKSTYHPTWTWSGCVVFCISFVACCVWCALVCMRYWFFISGLNNLLLFEGKLIVKNVLILFLVSCHSTNQKCVSDWAASCRYYKSM
jgi:hypothetical protein